MSTSPPAKGAQYLPPNTHPPFSPKWNTNKSEMLAFTLSCNTLHCPSHMLLVVLYSLLCAPLRLWTMCIKRIINNIGRASRAPVRSVQAASVCCGTMFTFLFGGTCALHDTHTFSTFCCRGLYCDRVLSYSVFCGYGTCDVCLCLGGCHLHNWDQFRK